MKQQPTDKETAKYNAVAEIAALLRETTKMDFVSVDINPDGTECTAEESVSNLINTGVSMRKSESLIVNTIFSQEEHETVKRAFLRLVSEI